MLIGKVAWIARAVRRGITRGPLNLSLWELRHELSCERSRKYNHKYFTTGIDLCAAVSDHEITPSLSQSHYAPLDTCTTAVTKDFREELFLARRKILEIHGFSPTPLIGGGRTKGFKFQQGAKRVFRYDQDWLTFLKVVMILWHEANISDAA